MITLEDVRNACFIDCESHWIYRGTHVGDAARIHAPNFTKDPSGQTQTVQTGRRAVQHIVTGKPIPKGWRTWSRCGVARCIKPECIAVGSIAAYGAFRRRNNLDKGNPNRIAANRKNSDLQRKVTRAVADDILQSDESNTALADRLGLRQETVSRVRRGLSKAPGNIFQGLMR